jgi:bifunctional non-homologous end joining protein LigD
MDIQAGGRAVKITHPDKVLFPEDGITKMEVVEYFRRIADVMVPLVRDRPLTLERYTDGIGSPGFYQKNAPEYLPGWIKTVRLELQGTGRVQNQVLCNDAATLVWLANQDCITQHVWPARAGRLDSPDRMIFDLDPPDDNFEAVRYAARAVRAALEEIGMMAFLMTTGSRGLHVVVPLDRSAAREEVRSYARDFAGWLAGSQPGRFTVEMRKERRGSRMFLDYVRNSYGQTSVAPYTIRARRGAPVATPVAWDELDRITSQSFNIRNIFSERAGKLDPWRDIDQHASPLKPFKK